MKLGLLKETAIPLMLQTEDGGNSNNSNQGKLMKVRRQAKELDIVIVKPTLFDLSLSI